MEFPNKARRFINLPRVYLKNIFNWANLRRLLAESLRYIFLINGAIISGTGSFKAIPLLFGILGLPTFLVAPFCWMAALTAFVCFYVQFDESMAKAAYLFIDICKNFIDKYLFRRKTSVLPTDELVTPLGLLQQELNAKHTELNSLKQNNEALCAKLLSSKSQDGQLNKYQQLLSAEAYQRYHERLLDLQEQIKAKHLPVSNLEQKVPETLKHKILNWVSKIIKLAVKFIAVGLVLIGCAVVIGMGIITTQAFVVYMGISVASKLVIIAIVLASTMKQLCQMTFTFVKQIKFYYSLFTTGRAPSETQKIQDSIDDITKQITAQREIGQQLKQIENELDQIEPVVKRYNESIEALLTLYSANHQVRSLTPTELVGLIESGLETKTVSRPLGFMRAATPSSRPSTPPELISFSRSSTPPPELIPIITPTSSRASTPR